MKIKLDIIIPVYFATESAVSSIKNVLLNTDLNLYDTSVIVVATSDVHRKLLNFFIDKIDLTGKVTLITHNGNKGFIHTCYTGIKYRQSNYKILLNSDTSVIPKWIEEMVVTA